MRSTSAVKLLVDPAHSLVRRDSRATQLAEALLSASGAAKKFAESEEVVDAGQRLRWLALSDSFRAQVNSLRKEVADGE